VQFEGILTALITPFKDQKVDYESLDNLLDLQIKGGIHGLVIHGTTAESPTLLPDEKEKIFKHIQKNVKGSVPLIVGTGSNSTRTTIEESKKARDWGADALLVVVPYYNKPPQRGLINHFKSVAAAVDIPIFLYNVPSRTVVSLSLESIVELSRVEGIIGIKEASGDLEFGKNISIQCGSDFLLLSGDDESFLELTSVGGKGVVSVISNILPAECVGAYNQKNKDLGRYGELTKLMGMESNPIPIKAALQIKKIIATDELRPPLCSLSDSNGEVLRKVMERLELI
jgi:4-hydroxy-tetrahydrodipicolinate synthase